MHTGRMLDSVYEVLTPEGVALRLSSAGPFPRALAWLIDAGARLVVLALAGIWFGMLGGFGFGSGLMLIVAFALTWLYPVMFETLWNGQTPGKRALGLRVVSVSGAPVGWAAAFVRNLLRTADMLPLGYAAGVVTSLFDPWGRRLGDLVAGTLVVHIERAPLARSAASSVPAQPPALTLHPAEQLAVIAFAERARALTPQRCQELAELARPITGQGGQAGVQALFGVANGLLGSVPVSAVPEPGHTSGRRT